MTTRVTLADIANRAEERVVGKRKNGGKEVALKKRVEEVVGSNNVIDDNDVEMDIGDHLLQLPNHGDVPIQMDTDNETETESMFGGEEYESGILAYLRSREPAVSSSLPSITPRVRAVLVGWLAEVHSEFSLSQDTLFLTVSLLDSYISSPKGSSTTKSMLQLVGVAAMLLAAKMEEVRVPLVSDFCYVTDSTYTAGEVKAMERKMLEVLDWRLTPALPTTFLTSYTRALATDRETVGLAEYVLELGLMDHALVGQKPSKLAAAALHLAMKVRKSRKSDFNKFNDDLAQLEDVSGFRVNSLQPLVGRMQSRLRAAEEGETCLQAVRQKYLLGGS